MVTRPEEPLNDNADPYLPALDQVAPEIVPVLPLPEASLTVLPDPSSKAYAATRPEGALVDALVSRSATSVAAPARPATRTTWRTIGRRRLAVMPPTQPSAR